MGLGFWAGAGALYTWGGWFGLGGQVQYTQGQIEVFGQHLNAGGVHVNALIGFRF